MATSLYVLPSSVLRSPESAEKSPALPGALLSELLPIVGEIGSVLDPDALLPTIARQLRRVVDYKLLDIFLPEKDGSLTPAFVDGYPPETAAKLRIRPGEGIVGAAARTREPIFVPDVSKDRRYLPLVPGVVAEMAIPLLNRDHLVGVLNIEGPDPGAFTPQARTALQVLARHLAVAIENATFYRETRWYAGLLATLYEIGKETASILDLDELLQRVAEVVKRVIDYEMFGILLVDEATNELVVRKAVKYAVAPDKPRIPVGKGLTGTAVLTKEPILVGDVRQDPRYLNLIPQTRSELVVPLVHKEKALGVFDLESPELNRFTEEHVKILTLLASQVAVAIENARLYESVREKEERLEKDLDVARRIQGGLFPEKCPSGPGWEASAHFVPAQVVGGDLYDFYDLGERMLGLAVGDVAGKGVSAALYGAFASGNVRARAFERHPPAELLRHVNNTLRRRGMDGLYCTLTFALFDFAARRVVIANSGLPYSLHYRATTRRGETIELPGLPLGAFDGSTYEEKTLALEAGDVLVFHSDGVTEAWNGKEQYGVQRLVGMVEANAGLPAGQIGEKILSDVGRFEGSGSPADDVTLVVVKLR
ncbi:MAG: serine/threonine protein phosphatase [Acidobacteria bacterium]|nr:MAG: serine/threonine protein phosphatase [Acidobacteriota bacterium]